MKLESTQHRIIVFAAYLLPIIAGLSVLFILNPANTAIFPKCPFLAVTGLCCPGCGTLRGLHELLHLRIWAAVRLNPFMVVAIPFIGYYYLSYAFERYFHYKLPFYSFSTEMPPLVIWIILGLIMSFWFFRNIPIFPFSVLAPHNSCVYRLTAIV